MYRLLLLILAFAGIHAVSMGRQMGVPFFRNYLPEEYQSHPQNWDAVQGDRGIMYFGNNNGILEYDGEEWSLTELPTPTAVKALAKGEDGLIYVGSQGDLGYLTATPTGKLSFNSLLPSIPEQYRNGTLDVIRIHANGDGVFFTTKQAIFRFDANWSVKVWTPKSGEIYNTFLVDSDIYVHELGVGLGRINGNGIVLIPGGERLQSMPIYGVIPFAGNTKLIAAGAQGLYLFDPSSRDGDMVVPFDVPINQMIKHDIAYSLARLNNGLYAVGTMRNGLHIIDQAGGRIATINPEKGLQNHQVWSMATDQQGGLWLCLNKGLARIEMGTPITFWKELEGADKVYDMLRFDERMYIAEGDEFSVLDEETNNFVSVDDKPHQSWSLFPYSPPNRPGKKMLLAGTQEGILVMDEGRTSLVAGTSGGYAMLTPKMFQNHIFFTTPKGVGVIKYENEWKFLGMVDGLGNEVQSIAEDGKGLIWLGSKYRGIYMLDYYNSHDPLKPVVTHYDMDDGLPTLKENQTFALTTKVVVASKDGVYRFDEETKKFVPTQALGKELAGGATGPTRIFRIDDNNYLWAITGGTIYAVNLRRPDTGNQAKALMRVPKMEVNALWTENNGKIVWVGGSEGLFRYESNLDHEHAPFNTLLRKIVMVDDSVVFYGNHPKPNAEGISLTQWKEDVPKLDYFTVTKTLSFHYGSTYFDDGEANEYSYFLDGNDTKWSSWTKDSKKEYTNLREGTYTFRVKSRNIFGEEGREASFRFRVSTPWYRSILAYIVYLGLLLGTIWGIVQYYTERALASKKRADSTLAELNTQLQEKDMLLRRQKDEIMTQNEEVYQQQEEIITQRDYIDQQNKLLREQNQKITDSIRYAQTIQEGLLPFPERLEESLGQHFVLYRPKDIVSGDFYWFEEVKGTKILALADCTGHGVPGAFMSNLGIAILNDTLMRRNPKTPIDMLEHLDSAIRRVLKQDQDSGNKDGMDISICMWKEVGDAVIMLFSGANQSLYYSSNGKLEEVKGERRAVGGSNRFADRPFVNQTLNLQKGQMVYLMTDGFADQHDKDHKKIGLPSVLSIIEANMEYSAPKQIQALEKELDRHLGEVSQRDDITIIGFKL